MAAGRTSGFESEREQLVCIRPRFRQAITFARQDIRQFVPPEPQDVVLCRNVAFTYFDESAQRHFVARIVRCLVPGGVLVVGGHESVPDGDLGLHPLPESPHIYARAS